jgi:exosortase K
VKKPQLVALAVTLAVVVVGKQYFRSATADELRWLLAPTATCTSVLTGTHFAFVAGAGYADRDVHFLIAPVCAGLHFLLAAMIVLVLAWLGRIDRWRALAARVGLAVVAAYAATIAFNTLRIALSLELHATGALHEALGIGVYFAGLCALYATARRLDANRVPGARWIAIPVGVYLAITLGLPLVHGAAARADFAGHALWVLGGCLAVATLLAGLLRLANHRPPSRVGGTP